MGDYVVTQTFLGQLSCNNSPHSLAGFCVDNLLLSVTYGLD